jgi:hypothetical protein
MFLAWSSGGKLVFGEILAHGLLDLSSRFPAATF